MVKSLAWFLSLLLAAGLVLLGAVPPNLGKAIKAQRRLVSNRPHDSGVHNDLGNLLVLSGDLEEAEAAYRRALELDPSAVAAQFNLGLLFQGQKQEVEALQQFRQVLEHEPDHAWAHYQIGTLLARRGQREPAVQAYATAISLDPNLAFADVNPHIIENELFTEALLSAHGSQPPTLLVPRSYDNPSRITSILVPSSTAAEANQGEAQASYETGPGEENEPGAIEAGPRSRSQANRQPSTRPKKKPTPPDRALRKEDLERRSVNQATPQPSTPRRRSGGVRPPRNRKPPSVQGGGSRYRPPKPAEGARPPGKKDPFERDYLNRFAPGESSSARLDLKLVLPTPAARDGR